MPGEINSKKTQKKCHMSKIFGRYPAPDTENQQMHCTIDCHHQYEVSCMIQPQTESNQQMVAIIAQG